MKNSNDTSIKETEVVNHEPLSLDDEWVLECFEKSPVYPVTIIGDMMYYPNEDGDGLDWLSVRMEVIEYNNNEVTNEKTITVRVVPEQFPEEEKEFKATILEKRTFAEVLKYGYVYNNDYLENLISYMQQSAAKAPHFITYNRVGWKEEKVKTKNGTKTKDIFRTDKLICNRTNKQNKFQFRYIGSLKFDSKLIVADHIAALNALLTTKGLQFAIVAGLSSVILARMNMFTSLGSMIVHIYGDSSRGKTTFLKTACSCWGDPNKTPLVSSWNSTPTAILTTLVNNYGITTGLDEASSINNDFSKTIYAIANGVDKKRATKELGLVETGTGVQL